MIHDIQFTKLPNGSMISSCTKCGAFSHAQFIRDCPGKILKKQVGKQKKT